MGRQQLIACLAAGVFLTTGGLARAADGCPAASFGIVNAPDGLSHFVAFSAFTVAAGGAGPTSATATCQLEIAPGTAGYSVYSADYRGFAFTSGGQTVSVTAVGGPPGSWVIGGPYDDLFTLSHLIGTGPLEPLAIDITLELDAASGPDAEAGIDAADFLRVGFTTWDSVAASLDQIARARLAVIGHLEGTAGLLLGSLRPIEAQRGFGPIAAMGSGLVGGAGAFPIGDRLTILAGAAIVAQSAPGVAIGPSPLLAAALRYLGPTGARRLFAEAGVWGSPHLALHFSRTYLNGDATVAGEGDARGALVGLYGRVGAVLALDAVNELVLSATLSHGRLGVGGYVETMTLANLFAAAVAGGVTSAHRAKATAAWTHALSEGFDMTLAASIGGTFGGSTGVIADIAWVGVVPGEAGPHVFAELGGRLGWNPKPGITLDAFAFATAGVGIGVHAQLGAAARVAF